MLLAVIVRGALATVTLASPALVWCFLLEWDSGPPSSASLARARLTEASEYTTPRVRFILTRMRSADSGSGAWATTPRQSLSQADCPATPPRSAAGQKITKTAWPASAQAATAVAG